MGRALARAWWATAAVLIAGCVSMRQTAPPVGARVEALAAQRQVAATELEHGRDVYISRCAECHELQVVGHYSLVRWEKIIPPMARKAKLAEDDTRALRSYLLLTREALETKG